MQAEWLGLRHLFGAASPPWCATKEMRCREIRQRFASSLWCMLKAPPLAPLALAGDGRRPQAAGAAQAPLGTQRDEMLLKADDWGHYH